MKIGVQGLRDRSPARAPAGLLWKSAVVVLLSVTTATLLMLALPYYHVKPIFLLLTVATILATLLGGWQGGLCCLALTILTFKQVVGVIEQPVRARLFANFCVDLLFIGMISYARFVVSGRERARLAAEARSAELEQTAAALRDALAAAEERREILEAMMEHIPLGITIADAPEGRIRAVSRFLCELTGKSPEELTGMTAGEQGKRWHVYHADGVTPAGPDELPLVRATRHGEIVKGEEWVIAHADGAKVPILSTAAPIRDREGHIKGGVVGWQDLTHRKQTEQALMHSEKLAATGRLAATIAHEINNPLSAMTNIVYLLDQLTTDPTAREYIDLLNGQLKTVTRIATQTLKFHRENGQPASFNLSEMLGETAEFYRAKATKHGVTINCRPGADARVTGFAGEIRQVMSNLLMNAIEATPAGGKVVVHCHPTIDWRSGKPGYRVSVADSGSGIDPQHRARIFEPFFTTKGEKGTGLGLWVSAGIVHRAGGAMRVWSAHRPGRSGTCFSVFLPADVPLPALPNRRRYEARNAS